MIYRPKAIEAGHGDGVASITDVYSVPGVTLIYHQDEEITASGISAVLFHQRQWGNLKWGVTKVFDVAPAVLCDGTLVTWVEQAKAVSNFAVICTC